MSDFPLSSNLHSAEAIGVAIVTGGAGGIGMEFAKALAEEGHHLLLLDLRKDALLKASEAIRKELQAKELIVPEIFCLEIDLTASNIIDKIENFCIENSLEPELLINNAGIFSFSPLTETDSRKIEIFIDLHVRAVTVLSRWFCSYRATKGSGQLLNMSSMSCWMPMPGLAMYASTKSYIRVFTRALHYEMKDSGVKVMVACPGGIATDLFGLPENLKKLAVGIKVLDTPDNFARKALKRLRKGKKQYINGGLNRLSIFFIGITPTPLRMLVKRKLLDRGIKR